MMGLWATIVDDWLTADLSAPRKQRHTARRVWERLVDEHQARVAESTVREYVRGAKPRLGYATVEVTVPQEHPLGAEAEVDFGTVTFVLSGVEVEGRMFVMRLSASGKAFRRVYLNEAQEVFLDGHVRAFEAFGGVPARIRYDNLKAAVAKVLRRRDRAESERFTLMRSHYRFDSFFCIPGVEGAHEKGGVEGEVGRFRRRALVPVPRVASMAELNDLLDRIGERDDERRHIDGRFVTVAEHLGHATFRQVHHVIRIGEPDFGEHRVGHHPDTRTTDPTSPNARRHATHADAPRATKCTRETSRPATTTRSRRQIKQQHLASTVVHTPQSRTRHSPSRGERISLSTRSRELQCLRFELSESFAYGLSDPFEFRELGGVVVDPSLGTLGLPCGALCSQAYRFVARKVDQARVQLVLRGFGQVKETDA